MAKKADRQTAAMIALACQLIEVEQYDDAISLLEASGDQFNPIDHAWILAQLSCCQVEVGRIAKSHQNADFALKGLGSASINDPTASALRASAASSIYRTASIDNEAETMAQALSAGDDQRGLYDQLSRWFGEAAN